VATDQLYYQWLEIIIGEKRQGICTPSLLRWVPPRQNLRVRLLDPSGRWSVGEGRNRGFPPGRIVISGWSIPWETIEELIRQGNEP
jgi:hypothetical protein